MLSTKDRKLKMHNRLWNARKRVGLGQKQLARLLDHKTADQVSRYERGTRLPTLQTALELEIALGIPLRILFSDLYEQLRAELMEKIKSNPQLSAFYDEELLNKDAREYCTYAEMLDNPNASESERAKVRAHVTRLAKKIAYL
jgi:transcriptional regulator with XRE-family HTH domain